MTSRDRPCSSHTLCSCPSDGTRSSSVPKPEAWLQVGQGETLTQFKELRGLPLLTRVHLQPVASSWAPQAAQKEQG